MAFFLMGLMSICFIVISLGTSFLSFYKQGKFMSNQWFFITLTGLVFVELLIGFTSLPTNYLVHRVVDIILMVALIGNIALYKKSFDKSRIILGILSILTLLSLWIFL